MMRMRNSIRFLSAVVSIGAMLAGLSPALADPLGLASTSAEPILPDPQPYKGPAFPAASATAGTADPGIALENVREDNRSCSALTPCAMPSPALMNSVGNAAVSHTDQATKNSRKSVKHASLASDRQ